MSQPTLDETQTLAGTMPDPPPTSKQSTAYVILVQLDGPIEKPAIRGWTEQATVSAASSNAAVRKHVASLPTKDGTYVAVPARSWQPVTVKTETTTKLTLT